MNIFFLELEYRSKQRTMWTACRLDIFLHVKKCISKLVNSFNFPIIVAEAFLSDFLKSFVIMRSIFVMYKL
jgi:hypothetical protein